MGRYVQGPTHGKAQFIVDNYNGEIVPKPASFSAIPEGKALVIVCNHGPFETAAYAYSEGEFEAFTRPDDYRPKTYVLVDAEKAITRKDAKMQVISKGKVPVGEGKKKVPGVQIIIDGVTKHLKQVGGNIYQNKAGRQYDIS